MNKFSSAIKDLLPFFMLTTVIVLIFTQIPLVLIIGQWICRENFICGFLADI